MDPSNLNIRNKRAYFEYEIIEKLEAGIMLLGSEIKSIRSGKASIVEGYCNFDHQDQLWLKNVHVAEYKFGSHFFNHAPLRERKLLLHKRELKKWQEKCRDPGVSVVPLKVYLNNKGLAKVEVALARGKKTHDKRESLKEKDSKRIMDRAMKGGI